MFFTLLGKPGDGRAIDQHLYSWIPVSGFRVDAALLFDQLSAVFVLLITGVGTLIHIYSIGYMAHDPGRRRFFGYMNLFLASMLAARTRELVSCPCTSGGSWSALVLPADQVLGVQARGGHGRQQGLLHEPDRRRRPVDRDHADVRDGGQHHLRRRVPEYEQQHRGQEQVHVAEEPAPARVVGHVAIE